MRHRFVISIGGVAALVAVQVAGSSAVSGQTAKSKQGAAGTDTKTVRPAASAAPHAWTVPKTPWGEPDLQGVWSNESMIPFERPERYKDKERLTDEEVAAIAKAQRELIAKRARGEDFEAIGRRDAKESPIAGNEYNSFWQLNTRDPKVSNQTSQIIYPADGKMPALLPDIKRRADHHAAMVSSFPPADVTNSTWLERDTGERCITDGMQGMQGGTGPNQIIQSPGYVVTMHEQFRNRRIIPTNGRAHGSTRSWFGDSVGHWEGNTLVVETTNYRDGLDHDVWQDTWRIPTLTLRIVERFTRVGPDTMAYELHIEDPTKFAGPWTVSYPLTKLAVPFYEYACHEGNYGMAHLLSEARNEEKQKASPSKR
jgi:hypothetical protein